MAKYSKKAGGEGGARAQKGDVESGKSGKKVKSKKQAIAIGLSKAPRKKSSKSRKKKS